MILVELVDKEGGNLPEKILFELTEIKVGLKWLLEYNRAI